MPFLSPAPHLKAHSRMHVLSRQLPRLFFMTDMHRVSDWRAVLAQLPKKSGVILRDYEHPQRPQLAREMAAVCQDYKHLFLIGADIALAQQLKVGLHLPEALAPRLIGRVAQHPKAIPHFPHRPITMAAHSLAGLRRAVTLGADGVFLSPVFATASHPDAHPLGVVRLAALCQYARAFGNVPIFALGGMHAGNFQRITHCGAYGYAAIGAFARTNTRPNA